MPYIKYHKTIVMYLESVVNTKHKKKVLGELCRSITIHYESTGQKPSFRYFRGKYYYTNLGFKCRIRFRGSFWFQSRR